MIQPIAVAEALDVAEQLDVESQAGQCRPMTAAEIVREAQP